MPTKIQKISKQPNTVTRKFSYLCRVTKKSKAMKAMRQYDVMTEERTVPVIGLAPMPHPSHKRRIARKPLKLARIMPKPKEEEEEPKSWLYYELREAFAEVKLMMDGKIPKISIDEVIEELRMEEQKLEQEDALRNSINQKV